MHLLKEKTKVELSSTGGLRFTPYEIDHLVDAEGHHHLPLDPEFPFNIVPFTYETLKPEVRLTWHNRLELFFPLKGYGSFRMGERIVDFKGGDVLVVDNLKLHGAVSFAGDERQAIVIYFKAELFYNLGSALCDFGYLSPFYGMKDEVPPILRGEHPFAAAVHEALGRLLACWFESPRDQHFKIGCKTYLSEILYLLSRGFDRSELARAQPRPREQAQRLGDLLDKRFKLRSGNSPRECR